MLLGGSPCNGQLLSVRGSANIKSIGFRPVRDSSWFANRSASLRIHSHFPKIAFTPKRLRFNHAVNKATTRKPRESLVHPPRVGYYDSGLASFEVATLNGNVLFVRRAGISPIGDSLAIWRPRRPHEPIVFRTGYESAWVFSLCAHHPELVVVTRAKAGSEGNQSAVRGDRPGRAIISK